MRVFTHTFDLPLANPIDQTEEDELSRQDYEVDPTANPTQSHGGDDVRKRRRESEWLCSGTCLDCHRGRHHGGCLIYRSNGCL